MTRAEMKKQILEALKTDPRPRAGVWRVVREMREAGGKVNMLILEQWKEADGQFAKAFDDAISQGQRRLRKARVNGRPRAMTDDAKQEAIALAGAGANMTRIAEALNVHPNTIQNEYRNGSSGAEFKAEMRKARARFAKKRRGNLL